ncbi:hypothetical protein [Lentzea sp. E54]|uniref:hypothetical protein n=1 Tax=Lentzea xerophila TaxID=3435883 RepID=UPI003DA57160
MSTGVTETVGAATEKPVRLSSIVRSELIKFTTVRSTWVIYLLALVAQVGIGVAVTATAKDDELAKMSALDRTDLTVSGMVITTLFIAALGVSVYANDHATGMIRWSYIAVPRRLPVLFGKVVMFTAVNTLVMVVGVLLTVYIGQMVLPEGAGVAALGEGATVRLLAATVGEATAIGLMGIAFGAILRNTAAAVTSTIGVIVVLPILLGLFGQKVTDVIARYGWNHVTAAVKEVQLGDNHLPGAGALVVLLLYVAVPLAVAAVLLVRRDV